MSTATACDRWCPLCGEENQCRIANGCLYRGACWCEQAAVPAHVLRHLSQMQAEPSCLCRRCLSLLARQAQVQPDPAQAVALVRAELTAASADFYLDEQGRTVFTAAYHLRRGHCCGNGCRHCPYPRD